MDLPEEIWCSILQNTKDKISCKNLYLALPKYLQRKINYEYNKQLSIFDEHICYMMKNKIIVYSNENIKTLTHTNLILNITFLPFSSQIIFCSTNFKIYTWDYIKNCIEIIIDIPNKKKIIASPCGKYLFINQSDQTGNCIYFYDINKKCIKYIQCLTNFTIIQLKINPVKNELAIVSYFYSDDGDYQYKFEILNYLTMEKIYTTFERFYSPYYDENGNLFVVCYRKGIMQYNGKDFNLIMKNIDYITDFIFRNNFIFFIDYGYSIDKNYLIAYDLQNNEYNVLYTFGCFQLKNINLSKNGEIIIFIALDKIIFFDIQKKEIIKEINEEMNQIEAFDIKNFYKYISHVNLVQNKNLRNQQFWEMMIFLDFNKNKILKINYQLNYLLNY